MARILTAAALTLALAAPAQAAAPADVSADGVARGEAVALAMWGPACGRTDVELVWATADPSNADVALAWSDLAACVIDLNPRWQGVPFWQDSAHVCALVVHEWGHLTGHAHSDDPTNVMYPTASVIPPGCTPPPAPVAAATHRAHRRHRHHRHHRR